MKRRARWIAAFFLALLLPMQGLAAACAQICLQAQASQHVGAVHEGDGHGCHEPSGQHDGAPMPDGKCCHAHTFMMERASAAVVVAPASFQPLRFVARWTSFIPEEPSPPPIVSAA